MTPDAGDDDRDRVTVRRPTAEDEQAKAEALALWEADRGVLLFEQPFIAQLAMYLDLVPVVDYRAPTALTDGSRIFVNPYFLAELSADERVFVLAHEVWHCALRHLGRVAGRERHLWNLAVDHEVNGLLLSQGLQMPEGGIHFADWEGLNAEEVYERLLEAEDVPTDRGPLADDHLFEEPGGGPSSGVPADAVVDPEFAPLLSEAVRRRWPERLEAAAQQVLSRGGDLPGALARTLEAQRNPQLDWRELLRQFVTSTVGGQRRWLPPSRRYVHQGLYLPSRREDCIKVVFAVDTSGSTSPYVEQFVSELVALLATFGRYWVRVMQCDCEVTSDETYTPERPLDPASITVHGFGGTDFRPVFELAAKGEPPDALVLLTDGYGPAPAHPPGYPVLWVLTPNGVPPVPWGRTARLRPAIKGT